MAKYSDIKHEDLIMKKAMDVFAEEGLKFFGIDKKVKDSSSTEIVVLEAKNLHMDYTFLMEDDTYIHVEFQTTDKGKDDLRRFRAYESLLSFQTGKDVVTYVVYSNGIQNVKTILETGINQYNVKAVSMFDKDGDIVIQEVEEKLNNNIEVTKQDLIALTFTPIMSGKLSKLDKIIKSIRLVKKIDNEYRYDVESMLYAFADKFLDGKDLEKVKEEISMTKLGEMLVEDGIKKGREEQATDTAIKAIKMGLDNEAISNLTGLTEKEINMLRRAQNN
ncbi:conserved hypothetical protein [Clostridium neonatale]|nr:conserved hypothetical protein [Clostridium neonatale]CAI3587536.1 conserved hypothetical protein [Clostridium neonatale]CAI3627878.1 conserved hypothetical protein [Clostridium neonatale]CAI3634462.1 conserved hypothetical protein [Clostridium neonatale]CAI3673255.1 conserved hypothetical protein [Clostridium neonatale]